LLDRIDIHVEMPRLPFEKLRSQRTGEPSEKVCERIEAARAIQRTRFEGTDL
jgi:magnesium chelatase family protein